MHFSFGPSRTPIKTLLNFIRFYIYSKFNFYWIFISYFFSPEIDQNLCLQRSISENMKKTTAIPLIPGMY
jgi:hypothetical protein